MTGFGKLSLTENEITVTAEVRSLNSSKGMDLNTRLPSRYREHEYQLRQQISNCLNRGKVDVFVSVESEKEKATLKLNRGAFKAHFNDLKSVAEELGVSMEQSLSAIMRLPDVYEEDLSEIDQEEWDLIERTVMETVEKLDEFRAKEGALLQTDLLDRIKIIEHFVNHLKEQDKVRVAEMRNRLRNNVELYIPKDKIDTNRYEQEIIYYLEKLDITEELTRLRAHCDHFKQTVADTSSDIKGRKLNFIAQEIGREINTVGSKANDAAMQKIVVNMKDELEKIKEQSNNVL